MKTIEHYRDSKGQIPFQTWFQKLRDKVAKASIARRLDRLAMGNPGDNKAVRDGVSDCGLTLDPAIGFITLRTARG